MHKVALPEKIIKMILKLRKSVLKRSKCLMEVRPAMLPRNVLEVLHGKMYMAFMQHWKEIHNNSDKLHPINSRAGFIRTGGRWRKSKTCFFLRHYNAYEKCQLAVREGKPSSVAATFSLLVSHPC